MGGRVGRGGRGRGPRRGNDECVDELNGQGNDQGMGANKGIEGVNGNVEGVNGGVGGAPDFSTIISQQLQNLLPTILAQVGNQGNVGNQNGNVVNENVRNVLVNENQFNGFFLTSVEAIIARQHGLTLEQDQAMEDLLGVYERIIDVYRDED
ncbi:hypothetical protein Tco_0513425 [Tanacetum coccineum]